MGTHDVELLEGYLDCPLPPSRRALMFGKMSLMIFPKLAALRGRSCRFSQCLLQGQTQVVT